MRKLKRVGFYMVMYATNEIISGIPVYRIRRFWYRKIMQFSVHPTASIQRGVRFQTRSNFFIGKNSVINARCQIDNRAEVTIGENTSVSAEVVIITADHDLHDPGFKGRLRPVKIGDYAFIGTRAILLPGVTVEERGSVGAGAVALKDVEAGSVVAGVPASPVSSRPNDVDYTTYYRPYFS